MVTQHDRRFGWLKRADQELAGLGAPPVNLARASLYWDDACEVIAELILDEYGSEFPENILFERVSPYDIALIALALTLQERDDGWYNAVIGGFLRRYQRRIDRVRESASSNCLPRDVRLSIRYRDSDADPGL
jgi:hypothetical protein